MKKIKIDNYDRFKCIANKCNYTCCEGWDINIDEDTFKIWEKSNNSILKNKITEGEFGLIIEKETYEKCRFLDCSGLCEIVKLFGEEYISKTCRTFPRVVNDFDEIKEYSLSLSCKEVVRMISENELGFENFNCDLEEYEYDYLRIRRIIFYIMNLDEISIEDKLIVSYKMLLECLDEFDISNIMKYKNKKFIIDIVNEMDDLYFDKSEGIEELNSLFLDITENYKDIPLCKNLLQDINIFSENNYISESVNQLEEFKDEFKYYNKFILDCLKLKVINTCVGDEIEEIVINFELIILEYILVKYSLFLRWLESCENKIDKDFLINYIMLFSRVIGNNSEAVIQFIEDGFESNILDLGYLKYIMIF